MTRRVLGVVLAIVLAVVGTGAVFLYVASVRNHVEADQKPVTVLVAKARIPAGTTGASIRDKGLAETVVMPASSLPDGVMASIGVELDKLVVTSDLQPKQLVLRGMFGQATKLSGGISVPEKMMAITAKFKAEEEVGGFVRPGSQIAVFATCSHLDGKKQAQLIHDFPGLKEKLKDGTFDTTWLMLPRVEVLAVGAYGDDGQTSAQSADIRAKADAQGNVTLLVTVSVNQADAERVIEVVRYCDDEQTYHQGGLYLALLTDSSEVRAEPDPENLVTK